MRWETNKQRSGSLTSSSFFALPLLRRWSRPRRHWRRQHRSAQSSAVELCNCVRSFLRLFLECGPTQRKKMESSSSRDASVSWLSGVARGVFLAKCKDTGTTPVASRQQRFLAMVLRHCCISQQQQRFAIVDKELGPLATAQVASALATDERYVSLNLAGNPGLDDGASALAKMLRSNTTLTEVDLRSNCVGPAGAVALFAALAEANRTLTSLDLSGMSGINRNRIGQRGAAAIAQMLAANQVLWRLCLQENGLGVEGIQALAPGLSANTSLAVLNLASNALGFAFPPQTKPTALRSPFMQQPGLVELLPSQRQFRSATSRTSSSLETASATLALRQSQNLFISQSLPSTLNPTPKHESSRILSPRTYTYIHTAPLSTSTSRQTISEPRAASCLETFCDCRRVGL